MKVEKLRMLKQTCCVTMLNKIINEYVTENTGEIGLR